jgi:hypothetical protein
VGDLDDKIVQLRSVSYNSDGVISRVEFEVTTETDEWMDWFGKHGRLTLVLSEEDGSLPDGLDYFREFDLEKWKFDSAILDCDYRKRLKECTGGPFTP